MNARSAPLYSHPSEVPIWQQYLTSSLLLVSTSGAPDYFPWALFLNLKMSGSINKGHNPEKNHHMEAYDITSSGDITAWFLFYNVRLVSDPIKNRIRKTSEFINHVWCAAWWKRAFAHAERRNREFTLKPKDYFLVRSKCRLITEQRLMRSLCKFDAGFSFE